MKKWYTSKTEIADLLAAIVTAIQIITGTTWIDQQLQTSIVIIYMIIIRFFTDKGITL